MAPKPPSNEPKPLLGRPSNNLKMGIVGLPNVGKSSFFNALTKSAARAENFPFCTIDPEESRVAVPDSRFDWLCQTYKPASKVPAYLSVIDIAGLVKGASAGQGLGNAFLSHIRAVDGIFHMVRAFSDEAVVHVEGEIDPIRDMEIINEELRLKDVEFITKALEQQRKACRASDADKQKKTELELLERLYALVGVEKKQVRFHEWTGKDIDLLNTYQLLTAKSVIFLINISEEEFAKKRNKWLPKIKTWIDSNSPGDSMIPFSCTLENRLALIESEQERASVLKEVAVSYNQESLQSALPKIIVSGYSCLQLQYYFTAGADEVRAWTFRKGSKAPQAAGVIHTDFERGFIMAEVMHYADLFEHGTEQGAKNAGKYYQKGKEYVVEDGDVIFFKFNVGNSKKK